MFKRALVILTLSSSAVFAGTMGAVCTPGNVTVPCTQTGWDIGGKALYLQTSSNNVVPITTYFEDVSGRFHDIGNQWKWGFALEGAYHFNTGNDVTMSWYHLDIDKGYTPYDDAVDLSLFRIKNQWDAVNGELGQFVDISAQQKIRFHGGFQFAHVTVAPRLNRFKSSDYITVVNHNSEYNGFGPRMGVDLNYVFNNGLSIYAKAATALLAGTTKFQVDGIYSGVFDFLSSFKASGNRIVPQLEAKLGGNYTYTYALAKGSVTFDAGYMWFNYFNAVNYIDNYVLAADRRPGASSSFGASGPYMGLKYVG